MKGVSGLENDGKPQPLQKSWISSVTKRSDATVSASAKDCWSFAREFEEKPLN